MHDMIHRCGGDTHAHARYLAQKLLGDNHMRGINVIDCENLNDRVITPD